MKVDHQLRYYYYSHDYYCCPHCCYFLLLAFYSDTRTYCWFSSSPLYWNHLFVPSSPLYLHPKLKKPSKHPKTSYYLRTHFRNDRRLAINRKRRLRVMHHWPIIVRHSKPLRLVRIRLVKVRLVPLFDVLPCNRHEIIPLRAVLLVQKAHSVHQLVDRCAHFRGTVRTLKIDLLSPSDPSHARPTAGISVYDRNVVRILRGFRPETKRKIVKKVLRQFPSELPDAGVFVVNLHRFQNHTLVAGRKIAGNLVRNHSVAPSKRFRNQSVPAVPREQNIALRVLAQLLRIQLGGGGVPLLEPIARLRARTAENPLPQVRQIDERPHLEVIFDDWNRRDAHKWQTAGK